ncbi:extracellular signal-regulated kinase 2-like [Corticium candelabrum]|uniref:extracellular signal-regulated kinase 2-like n=1 Tax=Corticium candelabrum TaxID=121492 RepID=UPI002E2541A8|nr:extracellular signal-regulated kinase 2-like [Corticium candelabrum]
MTSNVDCYVNSRYRVKERLGKGAYGIVWKAVDRQTGEIVALKKIFDAFQNETDAQRTYREVMFLQKFSGHDNVIKLLNVVQADHDQDLYLVFEYMDTDLHAAIKSKILQDVHKQYIMYQLLKAMKFIHSGNVVHRDMKPSNVLLNSDCLVKLCDFGLARSVSHPTSRKETSTDLLDGDPTLTDYVATRWYRAPEILLGSHKYTTGVDMWSLGCILGEVLLGKPLFPGTSTLSQVSLISVELPVPTREDVDSLNATFAQQALQQKRSQRKSSLNERLHFVPPEALHLLEQLLVWNPKKRLTADQAIAHPYVKRFRNEEEPVLAHDVVLPVDDNCQLSVDQYRQILYKGISEMRKELKSCKKPLCVDAESSECVTADQTTESKDARGTAAYSLSSTRKREVNQVNPAGIVVDTTSRDNSLAAKSIDALGKKSVIATSSNKGSFMVEHGRHQDDQTSISFPSHSTTSSMKPSISAVTGLPFGRDRKTVEPSVGNARKVSQHRPLPELKAASKTQEQPEVQRRTGLLNDVSPNRRPYGSGGANAGGPSRVSYGHSTHTYGIVSKSSFASLQQRQW